MVFLLYRPKERFFFSFLIPWGIASIRDGFPLAGFPFIQVLTDCIAFSNCISFHTDHLGCLHHMPHLAFAVLFPW